MSYPAVHAAAAANKAAVVMAESGAVLTYGELEDRSRRLAEVLRAAGLRPGDHLAAAVGNHLRFFEVYWAAMRSGLYFTPVNTWLTAAEAHYIVENCGATAVVVESPLTDLASALTGDDLPLRLRLSLEGAGEGFTEYDAALRDLPVEPLVDEPLGSHLLYSSGSTGRPKAITRDLPGVPMAEGNAGLMTWLENAFDASPDMVCLSPAPLYHAAPLSLCAGISAMGGTIVLMEHFEAAAALDAVARYRPTHALMVPTMFVRLLRLDETVKTTADVSSLRYVIHGASPCPTSVKQEMIAWWGPVLHEYYAGSEDNGSTLVDSTEWLAHPGTVGRASPGCIVHVCDLDGNDLPTGADGVVYFETVGAAKAFEYRDEPNKTAASRNRVHPTWTTLGDIGHLDAEGYLYLTDRTDYMIISGGVNISPQEIEDTLIGHPAVLDVAVFGVPDDEFGERVVAVVELTDPGTDHASVTAEIREHARAHLARHKVPRIVEVIDQMPRSPAGKLYKRRLRDAYLAPTTEPSDQHG